MSLQNPFAKPVPKQNAEKSKQVVKKDSTRENVKKQLINALEKNKDNTIKDLKFTSEQIAIEIEEEVFKQNDESSKNRGYRDKIRKLEMRIKGMRNNHIRDILKKGLLSVNEFCNLDEKELNNENFFKKFLESEKPSNGDNQAGNHPPSSENLNSKKFGNMPKIIKPPPRNMIPSIRPIIPKPIIPSNIQEKKIVDENEKNEYINKKEKSEDINNTEINKQHNNKEQDKNSNEKKENIEKNEEDEKISKLKNYKFAIICAYKSQVLKFRELKKKDKFFMYQRVNDIEINTVDSFQGQERDIIIFSTVRANFKEDALSLEDGEIPGSPNGNKTPDSLSNDKSTGSIGIGFLNDFRRMNVGLSRAKIGCFVVGHYETLKNNNYWKKLMNYCKEKNSFFKVEKDKESDAIDNILKQNYKH